MTWDASGLGLPDMGNSGPFRGALGEATEGSVRTFAFIRWPGKVKPGTSSNAMFSEMDFMPTFAAIIGAKLPTDRAIDGVDQTDVLFGKSAVGNRESLLTFVGPDIVAVRWKQWRVYLKDMNPTGTDLQKLGGMAINAAPLYLPEALQHPGRSARGSAGPNYLWAMGGPLKAIAEYEASVKKYPNPPAGNMTDFRGRMEGDEPMGRLAAGRSAQSSPRMGEHDLE